MKTLELLEFDDLTESQQKKIKHQWYLILIENWKKMGLGQPSVGHINDFYEKKTETTLFYRDRPGSIFLWAHEIRQVI